VYKRQLLEEVKATIAEIKSLLSVGNISGAAKLLGDARAKASAALAMLRRIVCAEHIMVKRMERYLEKFEEARSKIYDRLRMVPQHIRERVRLKLDEVENLLNEVRGMIRNRIMERAMNRIMEMHRRLLDILNETKG
ncbi:MAG: hypothetical protein N3E44_08000, partial [Candidatus Bathyarchaeota archaeon]|nr:hypothetical protein [Candidatus Bathyarchaeota archaeon]